MTLLRVLCCLGEHVENVPREQAYNTAQPTKTTTAAVAATETEKASKRCLDGGEEWTEDGKLAIFPKDGHWRYCSRLTSVLNTGSLGQSGWILAAAEFHPVCALFCSCSFVSFLAQRCLLR